MNASSGLIIHADDFGETVEITRGICQAIEAGAVTSTTIMANMPGTQDALPRVRALSERASFGVHLNFCEGRPLSAGSTLVDAAGNFHRKRALFLRALSKRLRLRDVEAEITAQIAVVHEHGIRISHVDGHKHLHQLPVINAAVAGVLPRFGIERVRITRLESLKSVYSAAKVVRQILARDAAKKFQQSGLRSPDHVLDLQAIMQDKVAPELSPLRRSTQVVVEMFCHPGTELADREKPGSCARHAELNFLLSPRFMQLLEATRSKRISYWDI